MLGGKRHQILNQNGTDPYVPRRALRPRAPEVATDCWELLLLTMPCLLKVLNTYFVKPGLLTLLASLKVVKLG